MQVEIRHNPGFARARCLLAPNEPMRAESGAMAAMSADVAIAAQMEGGVMLSLKRSRLGGESLFITTYTAGQQGGWVDVPANLPGERLDFEFTGPGDVLGQSRNPQAQLDNLSARLPFTRA